MVAVADAADATAILDAAIIANSFSSFNMAFASPKEVQNKRKQRFAIFVWLHYDHKNDN